MWKRAQNIKPNKSQLDDWSAARKSTSNRKSDRGKEKNEEAKREPIAHFNSVISIMVLTNAQSC